MFCIILNIGIPNFFDSSRWFCLVKCPIFRFSSIFCDHVFSVGFERHFTTVDRVSLICSFDIGVQTSEDGVVDPVLRWCPGYSILFFWTRLLINPEARLLELIAVIEFRKCQRFRLVNYDLRKNDTQFSKKAMHRQTPRTGKSPSIRTWKYWKCRWKKVRPRA